MAPRQKQKRQDDTANRTQVAQSPVAEAIAIGTAAGGLVIGAMQATAGETAPDQPEAERPGGPEQVGTGTAPSEMVRNSDAAPAPAPAEPLDVAAGAPPAAPQPLPAAFLSEPAPVMAPAPAVPDTATIPNTIPAPMQSQLVAELSEQITATLIKAVGKATGLADADADGAVAGIADDVLGATSGIADEVLAEVAGIPSTILADGIGSLAGIPSALLGSDGAAGSDGLLSAVFYPDGAAEGLSIPDLSEGAASAVADIGSASFGLLGLSYTETHDHPGGTGSGLNALSIL